MTASQAPSLANQVAESLRTELTRGAFEPGQRLSESTLCERLNVSRNTLREAFRMLTKDGLLTHAPNREVQELVEHVRYPNLKGDTLNTIET